MSRQKNLGAAGDGALSCDNQDICKFTTDPDYNPFKVPPDSDMFQIRDDERKQAIAARRKERSAAVHEKHTHASRISHMTAATRRCVLKEADMDAENSSAHIGKDWTLETTKDHPFGKEGIVEYTNRKREMFLVKYAISVKREEMRKLEKLAREEEHKLVIAEQCLEEDAITFDLFLKENDKSSVEAIKQAEDEMKKRFEKVTEVKRLSNVIRGIQTEISKQEEKLSELKKYKMFLDHIKEERLESKARSEGYLQNSNEELDDLSRKPKSKAEDNVELYFNDPMELINMFHELEDQNLSLIQNGQDMEESIDEIRVQAQLTKDRLSRNVDFLAGQISMLEQSAIREEEKINDMKLKCEMFSFGEFDEDDQEKLVRKFDKKVEEVYNAIIGDNDAQISTLQMLTSIENTFGTLLDLQEQLPEEMLVEYEKKFEKERRARLREEKMREQEQLQKERMQRALQRAQAAPKTQVGRRPVPRSEPPRVKVKMRKNKEQLTMEQQEYSYFFEY